MWVGGDACDLSVHPVCLLQGSKPQNKLQSFSSCLFVKRELGDGGKWMGHPFQNAMVTSDLSKTVGTINSMTDNL